MSLREQIVARFPGGQVARGIVTLASGTAAAQGVTICIMPVVTRLYTPEQIGIISIFLSFFNFWAPVLSLRYEYALLNADSDVESHAICKLAMLCVAFTSILSLPALMVLHDSNILGLGMLPWWSSVVVVPVLFGYGVFMVYRSWGLRAGLIGRITKATVARSVSNAAVRVGAGVIGVGLPGLFLAELAGAFGSLFTLRRTVSEHFALSRPEKIPLGTLKDTSKRYAKFALLETPSTIVNQLALTLPVPMIATLYGPEAAGWFGLARAMVGIPNTQIGAAVGDIFQRELANSIVNGNLECGRRLFYKMLYKLAIFGLVPLAGVIALAPWAMGVIFGSAWREAGLIAIIIAPWLYVALIASSLSRALSVLQAQEMKLIYDVTAVMLYIIVFFASKALKLKILEMTAALSASCIFSYVIYLVVIWWTVEKRLGTNANGNCA